jgi:MipA family protein
MISPRLLSTAVSTTFLAVVSVLPVAAQDNGTRGGNWQFTGTLGLSYGPKYEGSKDSEAGPLLDLNADYKDGLFSIGLGGITYSPIRSDAGSIGIGLTYGGGRDVKEYPTNLRGLGDIDSEALLFVQGEYLVGPVGLGAVVTTGDKYGTTVDFSVGSEVPLSDRFSLSGSVNARWANKDHAQTYFGVSATQATATGLSAFSADSGVSSVGVSIGLNYAINERTFAEFGVDFTRFQGDVAKSPITLDDDQVSAFFGITRAF